MPNRATEKLVGRRHSRQTFPIDIEIIIAAYADTATLLAWGNTSRLRYCLARETFALRVRSVLSTHIQDITSFLRFMRRDQVCFSGSRALQVLHWTSFFNWDGDLDLYVAPHHFSRLVAHLTNKQGYILNRIIWTRPSGEHYNTLPGIKSITQFTKGLLKIDVIVSCSRCPYLPIPFFWSTLLMNFVGAERIVCAYPRLTLVRRGILNNSDWVAGTIPPHPPPAVHKYIARGFDTRSRADAWDSEDGIDTSSAIAPILAPLAPRFFGDELCLTIGTRVDLANGPGSGGFADTQATVSWQLGGWVPRFRFGLWFSPSSSMSSPPSITKLPTELVEYIADFLPTVRDLFSFTLTCRAWLRPGQKSAYRYRTLKISTASISWLERHQTLGQFYPLQAAFVHTLDLTSSLPVSALPTISILSLLICLKNFPNIDTLKISHLVWFTDTALNPLPRFNSLRSLIIGSIHLNSRVVDHQPLQLLLLSAYWKYVELGDITNLTQHILHLSTSVSIEHLVVVNNPHRSDFHLIDFLPPVTDLARFELYNYGTEDQYAVRQLVSDNTSTLKALVLDVTADEPTVK
ncbi:hypothetical protein EIP86_004698 [Pleurotus ostreatoroseus]|nr:hypothetical protein EIP86_004698 [Pleurotus ostreatoroseus]